MLSEKVLEREFSVIFHENNYSQSSFSVFQEMRINRDHTDVELKSRSRTFPVHATVLIARIPHFRQILHTQCKEVLLSEIDPDALESLINFAYEGKLKITASNVQQIFFAAAFLQLPHVQKICLNFMERRHGVNTDPTVSPFVKIIPSDATIKDKFDEFCNSEEFLNLPYFALKDIISRDDLKVRNEEKVFESLIQWTKKSLVERQHFLPYLLPQIRLNYLSPEYLIERVAAEGLIKMSEQCRHVIEDAKSYHLLKKRVISQSFNTKPRLYTESQENVKCDVATVQSVSHDDNIVAVTTDQNFVQGTVPIIGSAKQNVVQDNTTLSSTECWRVSQNFTCVTSNLNVTNADATLIRSTNLSGSQDNSTAIRSTNQNVLGGNTNLIKVTNQSISCTDNMTIGNINQNVVQSNTTATKATNKSALNGHNTSTSITDKNLSVAGSLHSSLQGGIYAVCSFKAIGTLISYYDCRNKKWDNFPKKSQNDHVLHVTSVEDRIFIFFENATETFNLVTHDWTVIDQTAGPVKGSGIISSGGIIYVFGGLHFPYKIRCFDTQQNKWIQDEDMKYPCRNMSVASSKKYIFLTGGYGKACCNTFLRFHTVTKKWIDMPSMISARMDHDSTVLNGKVYVCGGRNNTKFLHTAEVYDEGTSHWSFISSPNVPRHSLSLVSWGSKIYALGGMTEKEYCFSEVEVYDPEHGVWLSGIPVPFHEIRAAESIPYNSSTSLLPTEEKCPVILRAVAIALEM